MVSLIGTASTKDRRRSARRARKTTSVGMASFVAASVVAVGLGVGAAAPAEAQIVDCEWDKHCLNVTRLPGLVDWNDLVRRGHRFFNIDTGVFIVSFAKVKAPVPYLQREIPPMLAQVHIPEIYHATIESQHAGDRHFVWHYIVGHEFAHVYQDRLGLIEAMQAQFVNRSHVSFELHADFLAGFFVASEYGLQLKAVDQILAEVTALQTGEPGDVMYHGEPHQRFYMATQGALFALRQPRPTLAEAGAEGVRRLADVLPFGR